MVPSTRSISRCARISANTSSFIDDVELRDYRVRVFQGGTDAVTRVLIECGDAEGDTLVDGRRVGQHHRRVVPGAGRFDQLQADEIRLRL